MNGTVASRARLGALPALAAIALLAPAGLLAADPEAPGGAAPLPVVSPETAGISPDRLARIDAVVAEAIARRETPGAVVLVGRNGKVVFRRAYGHRALVPSAEPMTLDTAFDLASLTKPLATATSVMTLVEKGLVRLADPLVRHLPGFGAGGGEREEVTVEQLLVHRSGLVADDPMELYLGTPAEIFSRKNRRPLAFAPGTRFVYSDAGYEALGELVGKVTGERLDVYAARAVFAPLGMTETEFRPIEGGTGRGKLPVARIAPTETRDGRLLRGEVHDPRAHALGGVAGHAGLFSTADDVARYALAILGDGGGVLSPAGVAAMTRARDYGDADLRALGWDVATAYSTSRGDLFPPGSFGHTGWTGTSIWLDPATGVFVLVLSNRNHPDGAGNVIPLRSRVASIAAAAVTDVAPDALRRAAEPYLAIGHASAPSGRPARPVEAGGPAPGPPTLQYDVRPGVDVLVRKGFAPVAGKRVGLLTNATGLTREGRPTADVLRSKEARKAGVTLVRLFSPEHGLSSAVDETVPDSRDAATGLPVVSLYGAKRRPTPEDLAGLDAVVVDLQDAGCRFYTYLTTVGYLMEEAARAKVAVVLLDRPDPIGAEAVEGPVADLDLLSFTAYHPIPVRPGMTIGELSRLFASERKLDAALTVVPMENYRRSLWFDETGIPWVDPSPNLRSVTQAALYPGVALLETTNVSVGRGTESPFEVVGAPWVDAAALARTLSVRRIRGVRFTPVAFRPASSTHAGALCRGVRISVVDRNAVRPVALGLEIATALRDLHPKEWDASRFGELLASSGALSRFARGETAAQVAAGWSAEQMDFERRRAAFLLYEPLPR